MRRNSRRAWPDTRRPRRDYGRRDVWNRLRTGRRSINQPERQANQRNSNSVQCFHAASHFFELCVGVARAERRHVQRA